MKKNNLAGHGCHGGAEVSRAHSDVKQSTRLRPLLIAAVLRATAATAASIFYRHPIRVQAFEQLLQQYP